MIILGIETSCDETAASVIEGKGDKVKVLSSIVSSQVEIHKKYYGVVPEVAAREHVLNIVPVVNEALEKANDNFNTPRLSATPLKRGIKLDAIAVTIGPGLITSLIVGVETARTLAFAWKLPLVAVNHIEGHIMANFINTIDTSLAKANPPRPTGTPPPEGIKFPALILTVSGGHTMLVLMSGCNKFKIIGETRDDAAGEAFDKAAKLMKLGYPGGPIVSKLAKEFKEFGDESTVTHPVSRGASHPSSPFAEASGDRQEGNIILPRPMLNDPNFDFSFSGLKTALLYKIQKDKNWQNRIPEYCHEVERAIVETLVGKTVKAVRKYKVKTIMLSGGVAANAVLRVEFRQAAAQEGLACKIPPLEYTTDNAAMVAAAGYFRARKKDFTAWNKIKADSNLSF